MDHALDVPGRGAAELFISAPGISTLWQGLAYYNVIRKLANW